MKLALAHDYLTQAGGAERVVASLHEIYPGAPLYTSVYNANKTLSYFKTVDVRTTFLQNWPLVSSHLDKCALSIYPLAFEQFDFSEYDVVISSSSSFAKGIITGPETTHICYCHTPARFAWRSHGYFSRSAATSLVAPLLRGTLHNLRMWDAVSANRIDFFIANSHNVANRIRKFYRREVAAIIHPPVELNRFHIASKNDVGDHFLVVSRLLGYKRIDLAIQACNAIGAQLRIVGIGPELNALKKIAGPTIQFLGKLDDAAVVGELSRCKALIMPGEEDFGITPLEAMASGRPVVAYGAGGALETILDGQTGLFFNQPRYECLASTLRELSSVDFKPQELRDHAGKFDTAEFTKQIQRFVNAAMDYQARTEVRQFRASLQMHDSAEYCFDSTSTVFRK